ncbi:MAG: ATP-grasp domain-containing protein [Yaniella sp.]|uniref:ATP-grasp domain-containing protein n=2 Tax=Yaniella sp. TaxID=2773929 RepID=UPI0026473AC8|nr:ATP-grasp domain-containing protein [Yaniella sp.]MDN5704279.1 ATP-grasp domain-containing protein [Yaniella sp.]MDN5731705.1 ATP-grasp domain-containing protein [Yaniella sp.]MDN5815411.1 ATP-grasp domain-containing protein [Yaniella sp.]MDN5818192.1 ATP-grasp domain-containing protein [Yaniella sp.]MDN5838495.1 ATP-grasp domain-containing protein [Yaniella sp.]
MKQNIFVLGLDEPGHSELAALPHAGWCSFHGILTLEDLQDGLISLADLLEQAEEQLDAFDGPIDAIVGYWDFPVSVMVPILCQRYGLPTKPLEGVVKCEHKYWSRLEQQKVIDEYPGFDLIDIHDPSARLPRHMTYPAWLKPIKSFSSEGAHQVKDEKELQEALAEEREAPERIGGAFDYVLEKLDLPEEVAEIPGGAYMVEEAAGGQQYTLEGYSWGDQIEIIGLVDSFNYENVPSFLKYQYPSTLPEPVQQHIHDVSRRVISAVGLTDSTFNIEYFWDASAERLRLLEINSRHSQSHAQMFHWVDGQPNHAVMLDLALGREPRMPSRQGNHAIAAKWMLRHFQDGVVRKVPTADTIRAIEQRYDNVSIDIEVAVEEGARLSDADTEDSYSFTLAEIFIAGDTEQQLGDIYDACCEDLAIEIADDVEGA